MVPRIVAPIVESAAISSEFSRASPMPGHPERVLPGLEAELLPDEVEAARRVVEREDHDDPDRDKQVDEREARVRVQEPVEAPPPERHLALPLGAEQCLGAGDPRPDQDDDEHERHQEERERRRGRIVGHLEVARLDDVADHELVRRAEELGVDEVAGRRDEREQRARHDARHRQGQRHPEEHIAAAAIEVVPRLEHALVDPLQARVERQDHERQVVVGDARHHGERRVEQAAVLGQEPDRLEDAHHEARVRQDRLPGQRADQVRDEERHDHREQHRVPVAAAAERDDVRERVADQEREASWPVRRTRTSE